MNLERRIRRCRAVANSGWDGLFVEQHHILWEQLVELSVEPDPLVAFDWSFKSWILTDHGRKLLATYPVHDLVALETGGGQ